MCPSFPAALRCSGSPWRLPRQHRRPPAARPLRHPRIWPDPRGGRPCRHPLRPDPHPGLRRGDLRGLRDHPGHHRHHRRLGGRRPPRHHPLLPGRRRSPRPHPGHAPQLPGDLGVLPGGRLRRDRRSGRDRRRRIRGDRARQRRRALHPRLRVPAGAHGPGPRLRGRPHGPVDPAGVVLGRHRTRTRSPSRSMSPERPASHTSAWPST